MDEQNMNEQNTNEQIPDQQNQGNIEEFTPHSNTAETVYNDPNADVILPEQKNQYTQQNQQSQQAQQNFHQGSNVGQDNYSYNVGNGMSYQNTASDTEDTSPLSLGEWILTILVMQLVPCVGIIMYFVWAFSKNGNVNRKNFCRAYLIITGIMLGIVLIMAIIFGGVFAAVLTSR